MNIVKKFTVIFIAILIIISGLCIMLICRKFKWCTKTSTCWYGSKKIIEEGNQKPEHL